MKDLIGVVAALGVVSALAALVAVSRRGEVIAEPPPALAATAEARCPDFTLEDNGVCLPLGRAHAPHRAVSLGGWVPRAALLAAFVAPWSDAPVPSSARELSSARTPVVIVRTRVQSPVSCAVRWAEARVSHVGQTQEGAPFIRISGKGAEGAPAELLLWGLTRVEPDLTVDAPCNGATLLGTSGDVLTFALSGTESHSAENRSAENRSADNHSADNRSADNRSIENQTEATLTAWLVDAISAAPEAQTTNL